MLIIIIPDVHLKPWMFERADAIMTEEGIDQAVCLMDIPDDWRQQWNLPLYEETYDAAIRFAENHPSSLWCYGNHDICYPWNQRESGYSLIAPYTVCKKLEELEETLPNKNQIAFIHRIDNVIFLHGGLTQSFVDWMAESNEDLDKENPDEIVREINSFGYTELWNNGSPLWFRPQYDKRPLYGEGKLLQVVGHTPIRNLRQEGNLLSCDVFSTHNTGERFGSQEFCILDTETWKWRGRK